MITVELLQTINYYLALGGLLGIALIVVLVFDFLTGQRLKQYIHTLGVWAMFVLVLFTVSATLLYSEVIGIVPCGFCWFERIFLYPQLFILGVALYIKDKMVATYTALLSAVGFLIALYHHYIQMGGSQFIACPTSGTGADCAKQIMLEFGFITFPMLAVIGFGIILSISWYLLKSTNSFQKAD
jgi:disulfide bond formation protein DsbB